MGGVRSRWLLAMFRVALPGETNLRSDGRVELKLYGPAIVVSPEAGF